MHCKQIHANMVTTAPTHASRAGVHRRAQCLNRVVGGFSEYPYKKSNTQNQHHGYQPCGLRCCPPFYTHSNSLLQNLGHIVPLVAFWLVQPQFYSLCVHRTLGLLHHPLKDCNRGINVGKLAVTIGQISDMPIQWRAVQPRPRSQTSHR